MILLFFSAFIFWSNALIISFKYFRSKRILNMLVKLDKDFSQKTFTFPHIIWESFGVDNLEK